MPLSTRSCSSSVAFDPKLCDNARMLLIGVKRYEHFNGQDVNSAHNNLMAWMVQLMRMGMSPHGNAVHIDATSQELAAIVDDVLLEADLNDRVREQIRIQTDQWLGRTNKDARWDDNATRAPTFANLLISMVDLANHLHWIEGLRKNDPRQASRRLMMVFSGHGALSAGRFVICPSDAAAIGSVRASDPAARKQALLKSLAAQATVVKDMFTAAEQRNALSELLDVLERAAVLESWKELYLDLPTILRNLRQIPKQTAVRADLVNVITPVHVQLVFGALGERVTLVLDACHSGGDGAALQGSAATSEWTRLGVPCRIISASQKSQLAAEATLGERRYSAATWALTHVLSRWEAVTEVDGYAMGITHGNLLLRANMLLEALSFNQQLSLSSPPSRRRTADMPFFGQHASTETTVDPNADAGGIQLDSDTPRVWEISVSGTLRAVLYVNTPASPAVDTLSVFGDDNTGNNLQGSAFSMRMVAAHTSTNVPADELAWYNQNRSVSFRQLANVTAAPSSEPAYPTNPAPPSTPAYVSYQYGSARKVWMRWLPATQTNKGALVFVLNSQTAYDQTCFDANNAMSFTTASSVPFDSTWSMATITLT